MPFQDIIDSYHGIIKNLADRVTYGTKAKKDATEEAAYYADNPNGPPPEKPMEDEGSDTEDEKKSKGGFQKMAKEK